MIINKEYPATHSMATAWYCVDAEGNVGVFDIDDNGPVPVGEYRENSVEEVFWEDFSCHEKDGIKQLHLLPEQITTMLERDEDRGVWEKDKWGWTNYEWIEKIVKIDMSKIDVFKHALSMVRKSYSSPVCLSKELGLFYVDFHSNKEVMDLLEKEGVILEMFKSLHFIQPDEIDDKERINRENQKFPFFIYRQDYCLNYEPSMRLTIPASPMKIEQLPEKVQKNIKRIPVRFKNTDRIQLAELLPVDSIWSLRYAYDNKIWWELASSDNSLIYYNMTTNKIISKQYMDELIANREAEEWDYDKHLNYEE